MYALPGKIEREIMAKKLVKTIKVVHSDADYLKYELAKILGCDETEEAILNAVRSLKAVAVNSIPKEDLIELANMWEGTASVFHKYGGSHDEAVGYAGAADDLRTFLSGDRSVIEKIKCPVGWKD